MDPSHVLNNHENAGLRSTKPTGIEHDVYFRNQKMIFLVSKIKIMWLQKEIS